MCTLETTNEGRIVTNGEVINHKLSQSQALAVSIKIVRVQILVHALVRNNHANRLFKKTESENQIQPSTSAEKKKRKELIVFRDIKKRKFRKSIRILLITILIAFVS